MTDLGSDCIWLNFSEKKENRLATTGVCKLPVIVSEKYGKHLEWLNIGNIKNIEYWKLKILKNWILNINYCKDYNIDHDADHGTDDSHDYDKDKDDNVDNRKKYVLQILICWLWWQI